MKKLILLLGMIVLVFSMCKKDKKNSVAIITTNDITELAANSAKTGGAITDDGGSAITKKGVCWAIHATPTVADSITNDGSGSSSFTRTLSSLNAYTTYYVRAYGINATGTAYGNEVTFRTNAGLGTLTTAAVTNIVALSASGGGEVTNDGGASITERGLVYGTSTNPTTSNYKIISGTGTGSFTATLSPLASQQTYYVRAYAINSYGTSYGNQVQFSAASANTVTDVDGNVYQYVTVCGKQLMASNLKTTHYKNGDSIVNGYLVTNYNWYTDRRGAYTYPNGDPTKDASYGKLYNIASILDNRGVCPTGWHVPTDDEWKAIEICQGMTQADADALNLRGTVGANFLEGGSTGLNLKKSGYLYSQPSGATYLKFDQYGMYWSSTRQDPSLPIDPNNSSTYISYYRGFNISGTGPIYRQYTNGYSISVRCVKD